MSMYGCACPKTCLCNLCFQTLCQTKPKVFYTVDTMEISQASESENLRSDLNQDFKEVLQDLPEVLTFIHRLQDHITWQEKKINKLRNKLTGLKKENLLCEKKVYIDCGTQTESKDAENKSIPEQDWTVLPSTETVENIVEQVTKAAESALQQTGFVYEETSGLYYDYNSGYYYDAEQGLYYDGNSGTYYYYDEPSKSYKFHSQAELTSSETALQKQTTLRKEKRKAKKANKDVVKKRKSLMARKSESGNEDDQEEGECSASDTSSSTQENTSELSSSNESENEGDQEVAKSYPPCIRIIVKETNIPKLKLGSLFVVAYTGGSMGREGDHAVLIPDINISKQHARFQYDESKKQYEIIDLGSRNGTLLNGKRLSVAKQESDPSEIVHGSVIQVGSTKLLCHIHNGYETCGHCEPGLVQKSATVMDNVSEKKDQHKLELKRLKHKFGVEKNNVTTSSQVAPGYTDRAQARRVLVGSLNHHAKTEQSSLDTSIAKDNKGFKLLSKMGWSEGKSLGKDGDGRTEPVPLVSNHNKAGLGASESELPAADKNPKTEKKKAIWKKTQQRYEQSQNCSEN
ncbi:angiogenic factor with G patch and FHA domains 1 isoform X1 [Athalia rosae]|uniref:angiogenic factor with G patch and FHA domains 1 isoform X1 n=1 Tax=Athalia rosae TaxID=37344 RepID=UPI00203373B2|nr:angiogenic factor with G patch and FHA domains 1 isoform X1 [Athalia rosae]